MYFRRKVLFGLLKFSDLFILIIGILSASWFSSMAEKPIGMQDFFTLRIKLINIIFMIIILFFWHFIFKYFDLYRSRRLNNKIQECNDVLKATTIGTVIFFIIGIIFNIETFTLNFFAILWFSTSILTLIFRVSLRYLLIKMRLHDRNLRFVAIIGTNQRAYRAETWIKKNKESGYRVKGYIDDVIYHPKKQINILGKLSDFPNIISSTAIDEVFIALPIKSKYDTINKVISQADEQGIIVRYSPQFFDTTISSLNKSSFETSQVFTTFNGTQENWQIYFKRTLDIILSSALLILTFPLLLAVAIVIKLDSTGPIFFIQDRVGYNKRIFRLYKFRSMIINADELQADFESLNKMDGPVFKIQHDPRVTTIGKWLRKTSIDELPQIINVLKGEMSLVGPRPLPVRDFNGFDQNWHRRRFSVPPGITCLWQISGRNTISFEKWMQLDMDYIDQWSFWLDLKILVKTIPAVLRGSGAS